MNKKDFFCLLLVLCLTSVFAQNKEFVLLDSISGEPIPYASVLYIQKGFGGHYSDEQGSVNIPDSVNGIKISHIAYEDKIIFTNKLNAERILLTPKIIKLQELIVTRKNKLKEEKVGFYKSKHSNSSFGGATGYMLALYIPFKTEWEFAPIISQIHGIITKGIKIKEKYDVLLRIDLQQPDDKSGEPNGVSLLNNSIIYKTDKYENEITLNLPEPIVFPKNGVFIVVEWISTNNSNKTFKILNPAIKTTFTSTMDYTWIKRIYSGQNWHKCMDDPGIKMIRDKYYKGKINNICFGLTIYK